MIHSMTGFGEGEARSAAGRVRVRMTAVNRRQLDVQIQMPKEFAPLEPDLRARVQGAFSRGRIQIGVEFQSPPGDAAALLFDVEAAVRAASALRALQRSCGIEGGPNLETVLKVPGVLRTDNAWMDAEGRGPVRELLMTAADAAAGRLREEQEREGAALAADLRQRLERLQTWLDQAGALAPEVAVHLREALRERVQRALGEPGLDEDRLVREAVLLADKADISEEITRAGIHVQRFHATLEQESAAGRKLDFLAQELAREFNTMSAKASDARLSEPILLAKTEVERIREQVQNLE